MKPKNTDQNVKDSCFLASFTVGSHNCLWNMILSSMDPLSNKMMFILLAHPVIHFYLPRSETSNRPMEFHLGVFWTPKSHFLQRSGVRNWFLTFRWPLDQNALSHSRVIKTPLAKGLFDWQCNGYRRSAHNPNNFKWL